MTHGAPDLDTPPTRLTSGRAPLRVLLVTNMYPTVEEPWYGCFVRDQVEDLRSLGVDMHVLAFDGRRDVLGYGRTAREVRQRVAAERFDLVHAHYGLTGATALLQRRIPLVTTFHGSDCNGPVPWQRWVSWVVARRSLPIFVSEEGRRMLGRTASPVIPAGVDTDLFETGRSTGRTSRARLARGRAVHPPAG